MTWMWLLYALIVLVISGLIGLHLGQFREAYTEMTGMMAGMTMGMLNGFLLGYAAAAATNMSMFWGNIFGSLLGLTLGSYFGRAGGLMGIMDGGMGGVMGGSMGAMLAVMVAFPREGIYWTAGLLALLYIVGMLGLVALIEQNAPEHTALHRVLPMFTRAVAAEATEEVNFGKSSEATGKVQITDYYRFLDVPDTANAQEVGDAYLARLASSNEGEMERAELALAILTDPRKREVYDRRLSESRAANSYGERGACCPPRKVKTAATVVATAEPLPGSTADAVRRGNERSDARRASADAAVTTRTAQKAMPGKAKAKSKPQVERELPISWVGVLALGVTIVMVVAWWLAGQNTAQSAQAKSTREQLIAQAVAVPVAANGKQTLDFVVNGYTRSYEPKAIKVKKGVPVHFDIKLNGPDPGCTRFIAIRDLDVHGVAIANQDTSMDFTPTKSGVFEINCEMHMTPPSYLVVTD